MLGYNHLTTPRPPSVSEHLIPWLFNESLFPTIRIVTKELARLKRGGHLENKGPISRLSQRLMLGIAVKML